MTDVDVLEGFLAGAHVDAAVFALRPGLPRPAGGRRRAGARARATRTATRCCRRPKPAARQALSEQPVDQLPHVAAWREAYRAFGAKPQRTRNSVEALLRRAASRGCRG